MTFPRNSIKRGKPGATGAKSRPSGRAGQSEKRTISATKRWLLISRNVYDRAQKRGFVGGDPFEDLSEAIHQVDDEYATDIKGLLSLSDPAELVEQFRNLFAGYGLGKRSLDQLLEQNRDALEKLAASNRAQPNGTRERATSLLRDAAGEAMQALQSITEGARAVEQRARLPGRPTQALLDMLSRLSNLADSAGEIAGTRDNKREIRTHQGTEIHGAVVQAYEGMSLAELADAPTAALRGLSPAKAGQLEAAFGMVSIRDMASNRLVEKAVGVVALADEEAVDADTGKPPTGRGSLRASADSPVSRLEGITSRQARVLRDAFHIRTIRDLAGNRLFKLARAIVTLADLEN